MLPGFQFSDSAHARNRDAVPLRYGLEKFRGLPDREDIDRSNLGAPIIGAFFVCASPLRDHIGHIPNVVGQEQMVRVAARPDVALVADEKPVRDRSIRKNPGNAVSLVSLSTEPEHSVPIAEASGPEEAVCRTPSLDFPKKVFCLVLPNDAAAQMGAESLRPLAVRKEDSASFAVSGNLPSSHEDLLRSLWSGSPEGPIPPAGRASILFHLGATTT